MRADAISEELVGAIVNDLQPPADAKVLMRARFDNTNAGEPSFVAFCTVQESTFFGADLRVAKSEDANDNSKRRRACYSQSPCGTVVTGASATTLPSLSVKNIHTMVVTAPDYVQCNLLNSQLANLEMQVRGPGDVFAAPLFALPSGFTGAPYSAGGSDQTTFYIFTGEKNAFTGGISNRLYIDVSYREGSSAATFPIEYGITCYSGNGVSIPWFRAQPADDF